MILSIIPRIKLSFFVCSWKSPLMFWHMSEFTHTHEKGGLCSTTANFRFKNQRWRDFMKAILQNPFQEILGTTAKPFVQSSGLVINVFFIWNWNKKIVEKNDDDLHSRIFHRRTSLPLREPWAQPPRKMALATIALCFAQISTAVEFRRVRIYGSH